MKEISKKQMKPFLEDIRNVLTKHGMTMRPRKIVIPALSGPSGELTVIEVLSSEGKSYRITDELQKPETSIVLGRGNCPDCVWEPGSGCNTDRDSRTCKLNRKKK